MKYMPYTIEAALMQYMYHYDNHELKCEAEKALEHVK